MKSFMRLIIAISVVILCLTLANGQLNKHLGYTGKNKLMIYNWGEYIDPDLISKFEKQTGISVIYQTFDSNEAMMVKIAQGGSSYDLVVPSDYAVDKMKKNRLLEPIDHLKIPNIKYIDRNFLNLSFDKGNHYSVPYFWGTLGIVVNQKMFGNQKIESWSDLWNPSFKNKILLVESTREVMTLGLEKLHYSLNETNSAHLQDAKNELIKLAPNIKAIVGDEMNMMMINNEAPIGVIWSGNAAEMLWENEDLTYIIPKEGSNVWLDNFAIPKGAKNKEAAYKFINFMLDPKNAEQNTEYVGYATPSTTVKNMLPKDISGDKRFYPNQIMMKKLGVYNNLGRVVTAEYSRLFLEFEMHLNQ